MTDSMSASGVRDPVMAEHHIIMKVLASDQWECSCGAEVIGEFRIMELEWEIHHPASDGDFYCLRMENMKPGVEIDLATATLRKKMTDAEQAAYKDWYFGPGWSAKVASLKRIASLKEAS